MIGEVDSFTRATRAFSNWEQTNAALAHLGRSELALIVRDEKRFVCVGAWAADHCVHSRQKTLAGRSH